MFVYAVLTVLVTASALSSFVSAEPPPQSQRVTPGGCTFASARTGANFNFTFTRKDAGVTDDGRGTYVHGVDGVESLLQNAGARLYPFLPSAPEERRKLTVDLDRPVDPASQKAYGKIQRADTNFRVHWRTDNEAKTIFSILDIPVGAKVTSERVEVSVMIEGRQHILRFGALDVSVCWPGDTLEGKDTSRATVTRTSETEWAVDLPPGSRGRLWDLINRSTATTTLFKLPTEKDRLTLIDKGLYSADFSVLIQRR